MRRISKPTELGTALLGVPIFKVQQSQVDTMIEYHKQLINYRLYVKDSKKLKDECNWIDMWIVNNLPNVVHKNTRLWNIENVYNKGMNNNLIKISSDKISYKESWIEIKRIKEILDNQIEEEN